MAQHAGLAVAPAPIGTYSAEPIKTGRKASVATDTGSRRRTGGRVRAGRRKGVAALSAHAQHVYHERAAHRDYRRPSPKCGSYQPSRLEEEWSNAWAKWEAQRTPVTRDVFCALDRQLGQPQRSRDASTLQCGGQRVAIEPLVGLLRNPLYPCHNSTIPAALVPSYLWLDEVPPRHAGGRAYLLDMGASTWTGGGPGEREVGFSATHWLVEVYAQRGVAFDRILAWEATQHKSSQVWNAMPVEISSRTSYYNVPISADRNSSSHPWRNLLELATPDDFVVVKLDVDQPAIEASLVQQLIDDPAIHARVDVLLYEQHWFQATTASAQACSNPAELCIAPNFHRQKHVGSYKRTFLSATRETFARLRRLGVLAHYWY